jgi:hypothetical protein
MYKSAMEEFHGLTIHFYCRRVRQGKTFRNSPSSDRKHGAGLLFLMVSHGRCTAEELADLYGIGAGTVYGDIKMVRLPNWWQAKVGVAADEIV